MYLSTSYTSEHNGKRTFFPHNMVLEHMLFTFWGVTLSHSFWSNVLWVVMVDNTDMNTVANSQTWRLWFLMLFPCLQKSQNTNLIAETICSGVKLCGCIYMALIRMIISLMNPHPMQQQRRLGWDRMQEYFCRFETQLTWGNWFG